MHSQSATSAKAISVANRSPFHNHGVDTNVWTDKTRMGELRRMTAFKLSWLMGGIAPPQPLIKSAHEGQAMASAKPVV